MTPIGQAKTEIEIVDMSTLVVTGLKGITGVLGITERGEIGKPTLVGSWLEYTRTFGGLMDGISDFPLLCRRALESGAKLRISRVAHYGDITDLTTLEGDAASLIVQTNFKVTAKSVGIWGNKVAVQITNAANGVSGEFDIKVTLDKYDNITEIFQNVASSLTKDVVDSLSSKSRLVNFAVLIAGPITLTTKTKTYLANGSQDVTLIDTNDYIGDVATKTGIHSFDDTTDITKIAVLEMAQPEIDTQLAIYADDRKDIRALLRTPVGVDGDIIVDYREGTGSYSHSAIDTWRASMFTGGLNVNHPNTGLKKDITELADVLGCYSRKDNTSYEWFSAAGPKRGRIRNANGVVFNLGSPARQTTADNVDVHGVNAVIEHPDFGVVLWGNSTLQKANTLLKHDNVAELYVFLQRALRPIVQSVSFDPNDVDTWKEIYRKVKPLMDYVQTNRGVWRWKYDGDQNVDDVSQCEINTPDNIDQGQYVFHLFTAPKVGAKYFGVKVIVANSGVKFEELATAV